jgi:hypothetical protein
VSEVQLFQQYSKFVPLDRSKAGNSASEVQYDQQKPKLVPLETSSSLEKETSEVQYRQQ